MLEHYFYYVIELVGDVNNHNTISRVQKCFKHQINYDTGNCIKVIKINVTDERIINSPGYIKNNDEMARTQFYPHVMINTLHNMVKKHQHYLPSYSYNSETKQLDDDYQSRDEIISSINLQIKEFNKLFGDHLIFTNDENNLVNNIKAHPLLKNKIRKCYWVDKVHIV